MNLGHWLERIKTKRKQRDKESFEKITKVGMNSGARAAEDLSPQAPALLVSSRGLLPTLVGMVEAKSLA